MISAVPNVLACRTGIYWDGAADGALRVQDLGWSCLVLSALFHGINVCIQSLHRLSSLTVVAALTSTLPGEDIITTLDLDRLPGRRTDGRR